MVLWPSLPSPLSIRATAGCSLEEIDALKQQRPGKPSFAGALLFSSIFFVSIGLVALEDGLELVVLLSQGWVAAVHRFFPRTIVGVGEDDEALAKLGLVS